MSKTNITFKLNLVAQPTLPTWVSAMPLWTWGEVPNSKLSDMTYTPCPYGAVSARLNAWSGAALKRQGSVYLMGANGGHADYAGNEVTALALNSETPGWQLLRGPTDMQYITNGADVYLDYRRASTHTYYGTIFLQPQNRLVITPFGGMGGSGLPDPPTDWPYKGSGRLCAFDLGTNDWEPPDTLAPFTGIGDATACLVVPDPASGDILYATLDGNNGYGWKYQAATNTWVKTASPIWGNNYAGAALDTSRRQVLVFGDFSASVAPRVLDFDSGATKAATFGGLGADTLKATGYPGAVYDEVNDCYLTFRNSADFVTNDSANTGSIIVHRVDAGTFDVSLASISGSIKGRNNGLLNAAHYVPELRGIVIANDFNENVKFMRTSA